MKEITSTTFGLTIGFLLSGLTGFCGLSFWIKPFDNALQNFPSTESNAGLLILVVLASLTIGLIIDAIRWVFYEVLWLSDKKLESANFNTLNDENRVAAFMTAVVHHYHYHKFYGGMSIAFPVLSIGYITSLGFTLEWKQFFGIGFLLLLEILFVFAAKDSYTKYVDRGNSILR